MRHVSKIQILLLPIVRVWSATASNPDKEHSQRAGPLAAIKLLAHVQFQVRVTDKLEFRSNTPLIVFSKLVSI